MFHPKSMLLAPDKLNSTMIRMGKDMSGPVASSLLRFRPGFGARRCVGVAFRFESSSTSDHRIPTVMERIQNFPAGAKQLYNDMLRYKNIHDASRTPRNAWTIRRSPLYRGNYKLPFIIMDEEIRPGRIPRREHEEQRRLKDDLRKVFPIVALWALPFVGYLPLLFAVLTPRQTLSRQFFNPYQKELFASIEYRQCQSHFMTLGEYVFSSAMIRANRLDFSRLPTDAAGPILDLLPFYAMFTDKPLPDMNSILPTGQLSHLESYPREHLIALALANGLYQHLPPTLSSLSAHCCPWLRHEIRRIGTNIATDDVLLLEEAYDSNGCASMTNTEVMDACLMRGLPVTLSHHEMRRCLTHHLRMIRSLKERVPSESDHKPSEAIKLLTMHLSAIRYYLQQESL